VDGDVLTDEAVEYRGGGANDVVQVDQALFDDVPPAEGEEPGCKARGVRGRKLDSFQAAHECGVGMHRAGRKLGVPRDRRQQIVEVVRNPTGELSECVHLLCLKELRFELLLLRDVEQEAAAGRLAVGVLDDRAVVAHPDIGSVAMT